MICKDCNIRNINDKKHRECVKVTLKVIIHRRQGGSVEKEAGHHYHNSINCNTGAIGIMEARSV